MNDELWNIISEGLPPTPSSKDQIPLPEILKVIRYCITEGVDQFDVALKLLDSISHLRSDIQFLNFKAMVEYYAKDFVRSFETMEEVLRIQPTSDMYYNAGKAAQKAKQLQKSLEYFDKALELKPNDSSILLDRAVTICYLGKLNEALEIIESLDPSSYDEQTKTIINFNKGWHYIRRGEFKKGMKLHSLNRKLKLLGDYTGKFDRPEWTGETMPGKTILMVGEAGIGDEVICVRFAKTIRERGMNVIMSTVHGNESMLSSFGDLKVIPQDHIMKNKEWDYWVPIMSLPERLDIDVHEIPTSPYLHAKQEYVDKWSKIIVSDKKLKVGIRWMGNPVYEYDLSRTLPIEQFNDLSKLDVQFFSLQKNDGVLNFRLPNNTIDITDDLHNWDDTMGAMMNMDLIITSCTSIAHVAGALGRPTWVLTPILPYYTWANMKKKSDWYETVSCYRQTNWMNWDDPFNEVKHDLIEWIRKP